MAESGEQLAKSLQNKDLNNKKRKNENLDVEEESIIEEDGDLIKEEEEKNWKCLMKGVVLLPQFLTIDEQKQLYETATSLGLFEKDNKCKNEKTKNMHMVWLGRKKIQGKNNVYIEIPELIKTLGERATSVAKKVSEIESTGEFQECVMNYYTENSKLGFHSETEAKGAVISFSIGDSASFLFKKTWSKSSKVHQVILKSGDVLIFGGVSRQIVHSVDCVYKETGPSFLSFTGRINFNLREK